LLYSLEKEGCNIFTNFFIGTTIQDGSKRERSDVFLISPGGKLCLENILSIKLRECKLHITLQTLFSCSNTFVLAVGLKFIAFRVIVIFRKPYSILLGFLWK